MEEHCFLACSSQLWEPASLYNPGPPVQGCYRPQSSGPSHINHQVRKCAADLPTGQSYGSIFSVKICSSQMCIRLYQVDKKPNSIASLNLIYFQFFWLFYFINLWFGSCFFTHKTKTWRTQGCSIAKWHNIFVSSNLFYFYTVNFKVSLKFVPNFIWDFTLFFYVIQPIVYYFCLFFKKILVLLIFCEAFGLNFTDFYSARYLVPSGL